MKEFLRYARSCDIQADIFASTMGQCDIILQYKIGGKGYIKTFHDEDPERALSEAAEFIIQFEVYVLNAPECHHV